MNLLILFLILALVGSVVLFVIDSVVMFIKDGIAANRESRRRKLKYTVMFAVTMTIIGTLLTLVTLLYALAVTTMVSM